MLMRTYSTVYILWSTAMYQCHEGVLCMLTSVGFLPYMEIEADEMV